MSPCSRAISPGSPGFADASVDCAICTMSLHHLPDTTALAATHRAIDRILKPDGGISGRFPYACATPRPSASLPTTGRNCNRRSYRRLSQFDARRVQPGRIPHSPQAAGRSITMPRHWRRS